MNERDNNIDALKVLANVLVIILHVSATYVTLNIDKLNSSFNFANLIDSFTRISVPLFVMISGYLTLSNPKNRDFKSYYKKLLRTIIYPTLIWSFLYVGLSFMIVRYKDLSDPFISIDDYFQIIINWFLGKPYTHLWYMYMMIGMLAFTPLLIRIKEKLSDKQFLGLGIVMLISGMFISVLINLMWFLLFIEYLGYFILGYSFKKGKNSSQKNLGLVVFGALASACLVYLLTDYNIRDGLFTNKLYFYGNLSPFVITGSLCTFMIFIKLKTIKFNFAYLAGYSGPIYFVHAGVFTLITFIKDYVLRMDFNPLWYIPVVSLFVYLSSLVISIAISYLIKRIRKKMNYDK
jgi:surface polysaccharide O-acyltransferase-like enzyme